MSSGDKFLSIGACAVAFAIAVACLSAAWVGHSKANAAATCSLHNPPAQCDTMVYGTTR